MSITWAASPGLGTRHGVVPWGDSSKQLRVSTAENRRFFYYLTADERVGDLMREELTADRKAGEVPVERKVSQEMSDVTGKPYPMNFLTGIEWTSVASAWLTEWERTGDLRYRDKLVTGMKQHRGLAPRLAFRRGRVRPRDRPILPAR